MDRHYRLVCLGCGKSFPEAQDGTFLLGCDESHEPALLRTEYEEASFAVSDESPGLFRFRSWLPVGRHWENRSVPAVFHPDRLGRHLGMRHLSVAFSGYWPERGAYLESCSFKELEALPVLARIPDGGARALVVSSAGNTGRAFLQAASALRSPVVVVVPGFAVDDMWLLGERHPLARVVVLEGGDYADAIRLGANLAHLEGFFPEGGARNVARRDGMGTVLLAAVEALGEIPDCYVQAVGSGTGAIAVWEMSRRLMRDGRFGGRLRLHLVQNRPFAPMTDAWAAGTRALAPVAEEASRRLADGLHSRVLSNRLPPFGLTGGVFDALSDTGGTMGAASNREAAEAGELFESLEGCDLDPAAEVALAGLMKALRRGTIDPESRVLLNLTGGGRRRLAMDRRLVPVEPDCTVSVEQVDRPEAVAEALSHPALAVL